VCNQIIHLVCQYHRKNARESNFKLYIFSYRSTKSPASDSVDVESGSNPSPNPPTPPTTPKTTETPSSSTSSGSSAITIPNSNRGIKRPSSCTTTVIPNKPSPLLSSSLTNNSFSASSDWDSFINPNNNGGGGSAPNPNNGSRLGVSPHSHHPFGSNPFMHSQSLSNTYMSQVSPPAGTTNNNELGSLKVEHHMGGIPTTTSTSGNMPNNPESLFGVLGNSGHLQHHHHGMLGATHGPEFGAGGGASVGLPTYMHEAHHGAQPPPHPPTHYQQYFPTGGSFVDNWGGFHGSYL